MRIEAPMAPAVLAAVLALIGGGGSIVVAQMPAHDCLRLASVKDARGAARPVEGSGQVMWTGRTL